jgi:hypothetical protein
MVSLYVVVRTERVTRSSNGGIGRPPFSGIRDVSNVVDSSLPAYLTIV